MLKIFQARLQKYVNQELPEVQAGFRKGRGTKLPTPARSWQKQGTPRKVSTSALAFACADHNQTVENC